MAVVQRGPLPVEEDMSPFLTGLTLPPLEEGARGATPEGLESWNTASELVLEWVLAHFDAEILGGNDPKTAANAAMVRVTAWVEASIGELTTERSVDSALVQEISRERERWIQLGMECAEASSRDLASVDRFLGNYLRMVRRVASEGYGGLLGRGNGP